VTFIDFSDTEGMLGLLVDLVADETSDCHRDLDRHRFLTDLLAQLRAVEHRLPGLQLSAAIRSLKDLHHSIDPEYSGDTVVVHLGDCIAELERVDAGG